MASNPEKLIGFVCLQGISWLMSLELFGNKEFIFLFQLLSIIEFEAEPACMQEVALVQDQRSVPDLHQFEK